jgi:sugar lactone lactonase YvrE
VSHEGDIFVSDGYGNSRVHKYNARGTLIKSWGSPGTDKPGDFNLPHGIGIDGRGRLLVCDRENHRIQIYTQDAEYLDMWTGFRQPTDVHVGADGTVYVSELQSRVTILDGDGEVLSRWGGEKSHEPGQFVAPHGIATDSHADVYVGEVLEGQRLQKFVKQ